MAHQDSFVMVIDYLFVVNQQVLRVRPLRNDDLANIWSRSLIQINTSIDKTFNSEISQYIIAPTFT